MFPVPAHARQLEQEWSRELAEHFGVAPSEFALDPQRHLRFLNHVVRVDLMDGSFVEFRHAFALVSEARKTVALFSEHCGRHVFPYHEARVSIDGSVTYEQRAA